MTANDRDPWRRKLTSTLADKLLDGCRAEWHLMRAAFYAGDQAEAERILRAGLDAAVPAALDVMRRDLQRRGYSRRS